MVRKLVMAVLISALALVTYSLWLYIQDPASYDERRAQRARAVETERTEVRTEMDDLKRQRSEAVEALEAQRKQVAQAETSLKTLRATAPDATDSLADEQRNAREAQIARMEAQKGEAQARVVELQSALTTVDQARAELVKRQAAVTQEELALKQEKHAIEHYLSTAWKDARGMITTIFFVYLFGGLVLAVVLYYGWAPWIAGGRPVELPSAGAVLPTVSESAVVMDTAVWPGEVLWVRKTSFQGGDSTLTRRKRLVLTWRMPFSCLVGGLVRLIELRNGRSDGERRVAFASAEDHFAEFAIVSIPENSSFMLRARFLKGIIAGLDQPPVIRRCWRFFRWQSWVTGQFGYFQFYGPCRLVVSCATALQSETLAARDDDKPVTQRASQAGAVGLGPRLVFKPVRSEGFLPYCRGETPLFDMEATGVGVILSRDPKGRGRDSLFAEILKVIGL